MKLIVESIENFHHIVEAVDTGEKHHYITGIFMQADLKNRNGRIYPIDVMEQAVNRYVTEKVNTRRAYGELNHPPGPTINLDRASHLITELKRDGNNFIGKARLMDTPTGNIAKGILSSGGSLGVSSRGLGSLRESNGSMVVQNDFFIATAADIVSDPSAPRAFVNGIMENADWVYDAASDSWYQEGLNEARREIQKMSLQEIENKRLDIFESFIESLKNS